ncbi:unnamed protein product [Strongylus vulgaris]|uniref:Uncharacterized protein n=1 Tax=Strongylus vulgaris TaxID=40348 RepID=A0A3P7JET1_STRVU|nr:unnamed protein product [Strongylus vulgaris]
MIPEYKQLLEENISTLYKILPPQQVTKDSAQMSCTKKETGCCEVTERDPEIESKEDLKETQPSPCITEAVAPTSKKEMSVDEISPCSSRPPSDIVPQSPEATDDENEMEITLHANFESFPKELDARNAQSSSAIANGLSHMVLSVSRMSCIEDEGLVRDFLSMFPNVQFSEEVNSESTHLVMMNSRSEFHKERVLM